jgi:asparagine synthase (glutamine-hydrolysing)
MSGGLDSTAVAAVAKNQLAGQGRRAKLSAGTLVYDRLIPDREREFAGMAAQTLGIPIHYFALDDYQLYEQLDHPGMNFPEPLHDPGWAGSLDFYRSQSGRCRVMLTGWDGDTLLSESPLPYFRMLLDQGKTFRALAGLLRHAALEPRQLPRQLRDWLARKLQRSQPSSPYPVWLNPEFATRLSLRERWEHANAKIRAIHPVRPYAHSSLTDFGEWSNFFDTYDPGVTHLPLEVRHPLSDLRLVKFCLALPPQPWCVKKHILRSAMRGTLPDLVRLRPKTPLAGQPLKIRLNDDQSRWIDDISHAPDFNAYVDREKIPQNWQPHSYADSWINLRPLSLNFWLHNCKSDEVRGRRQLIGE